MEASRHIQGFISGGTTTNPTNGQVLAYYCACVSGVIRIVVGAASASGSGATILDVRKNGASVWTDPTHRPTLAAGKSGSFLTYPPDRGNLVRGDIVQLIVVQASNVDVAMTVAIEEP